MALNQDNLDLTFFFKNGTLSFHNLRSTEMSHQHQIMHFYSNLYTIMDISLDGLSTRLLLPEGSLRISPFPSVPLPEQLKASLQLQNKKQKPKSSSFGHAYT